MKHLLTSAHFAHRTSMLAILLTLVLLAMPFAAFADYLAIDDDLVVENTSVIEEEGDERLYSLDLGEICENSSQSHLLNFRVIRSNNGNGNKFKGSSDVTLSAGVPGDAALTATVSASKNKVKMADNWVDQDFGSKSSEYAQATVTATASNVLGPQSGSVIFTAIGIANTPAEQDLVRTARLIVNWKVVSCGEIWTTTGFKAPVKEGTNKIKAGSTVPLKFNLYKDSGAGPVEQTTTEVIGLSIAPTAGCASQSSDPVLVLSTAGETALRYADGEFILNWKAPQQSGACYTVTLTAGNTSASANFELR